MKPISLVREFGVVASTGLAISFLLTVFLVPVLPGIFGEKSVNRGKSSSGEMYEKASAFIGGVILSRRKSFLILGAAIIIGCLYSATSLRVNNSILNYLAPDSPIQQRIEKLNAHLAGLYTLQIIVDAMSVMCSSVFSTWVNLKKYSGS